MFCMVFSIDQVPQALQTRYGASGIRQAPVPQTLLLDYRYAEDG
jgi:hypothetical protein